VIKREEYAYRRKISVIVLWSGRDSRLGHRFDGRGPKA
jgi:hypothetical protein